MKTLKHTALLSLALALFGAHIAGAQTTPVTPATVANDCGSGYVNLPVGRYTAQALAGLALRDNDISSVAVARDYEVELFDGDNFTGSSYTMTYSIGCIASTDWNDRASSLIVRRTPPTVATFYGNCNYSLFGSSLAVGDYNAQALRTKLIQNNDISSLRVTPGYEVQLFDGDNLTGPSVTLTADNDCLRGIRWDNRTSSLKVRAAAPASGPRVAALNADCAFDSFRSANLPVGNYTAQALNSFNLGSAGLANDAISAVRVADGYEVVLFDGDNFRGDSLVVAGTVECLVAQGWNDRASSLKVRARRPASKPAAHVSLYPNPVADRLYLSADAALAGGQYRILNGWGKQLAGGTLTEGAVDVAALPAGVYTLVVVTKDGQTVTRTFQK